MRNKYPTGNIWDSPNMPQELSNSYIFNYYKTRLVNACMARLGYKNLPDTCDPWYLENTLTYDGTATLMQEDVTGDWLSLGYVYYGNLNVYKMPTDIRGVGFGEMIDSETGIDYTNIKPRDKNFAIGFDNPSRTPPISIINTCAYGLWEAHASFRSNLSLQNKPYLIQAPKNLQMSIKNLMLKLFNKERVIQVNDVANFEDLVKVVDLQVPYIGNELMTTIESLYNQALALLGCMSETDKKERLVKAEASMNQWENQLNLVAALNEREKMLDKAIKLGIPGNPDVFINQLPSDLLDPKVPTSTDEKKEVIDNVSIHNDSVRNSSVER